MSDLWWFTVVLTAIIVILFILYGFINFWFHWHYRQPDEGSQLVLPTTEPSRRSVAKESTYVSVFYHMNEVTAVDNSEAPTAELAGTKPKNSSDGDDNNLKIPVTRWKRIEELIKDQKKSVWMSANVGCDVVVGVAASKSRVGGYLLNLKDRICEFYSYDITALPWIVNEKTVEIRDDSDVDNVLNEVRAKNLLFGLLLWEDKIKDAKKFKLYTDDESNRWPESKYGLRVRGYLRHLEECEKSLKMNSTIVVDESNLPKYVRFVLPAVDLFNVGVKIFEDYISAAYAVERFEGTHEHIRDEKVGGENRKAVYLSTKYYDNYLMKVKKRLMNRTLKPCYSCGYSIARSSSLQGIHDTQDHVLASNMETNANNPSAATTEDSAPCSLSRKVLQRRFTSLIWKPCNQPDRDTHNVREYFRSTKRILRDDDLVDPESLTPVAESEDTASSSSKATSTGYKSSRSTYSNRGTMRFFL